MNYHKRYICRECKREWLDPRESRTNGGDYVNSWPVSITGNPPGENCPICGSPEVDEILYRPFMPGLDIPRIEDSKELEYEKITVLPRKRTTVVIPGRTGADAMLFRETAQSTPHKMNVTSQDVINPVNTPLVLREVKASSSELGAAKDSNGLKEPESERSEDEEFDVLALLKGVRLSEKP